jgi:hypothetical protein
LQNNLLEEIPNFGTRLTYWGRMTFSFKRIFGLRYSNNAYREDEGHGFINSQTIRTVMSLEEEIQ